MASGTQAGGGAIEETRQKGALGKGKEKTGEKREQGTRTKNKNQERIRKTESISQRKLKAIERTQNLTPPPIVLVLGGGGTRKKKKKGTQICTEKTKK